jgi:hypothetical protein
MERLGGLKTWLFAPLHTTLVRDFGKSREGDSWGSLGHSSAALRERARTPAHARRTPTIS